MKTLAAILVETGRPLVVDELSIPPLKPGQVLVEIAFSGVCHTQLLECRGHRGEDRYLPHCLGHEGSGVVQEIGQGVTRCRVGDRVVLSWIQANGANVGGTVYDWNGRKVNAGGVTTFSRHAIVSENRATVIPDDFPLPQAALVGCALATGAGAVLNTAAVKLAQSVAVFGVGGVGLCSIAAAALCGAVPIIAVDVSPQRLQVATAMGATYAVRGDLVDPVAEIEQLQPGGVDFAVEASGRPEVMRQALASVRRQGGTAIIVGNAREGEQLQIDPKQLNQGKRILGTWGGDCDPDRDFPRYCRLIQTCKLSLEPLLSKPYSLADINQALDDLETRQVPRPLVDMNL